MKLVKFMFIIGFLSILAGIILFFVDDNEKPVVNNIKITGIDIVQNEINLEYGDKAKLIVMIYPANATNKELLWTSSNEDLVSVDKDGYITANKNQNGNAEITVKSIDGNYIDTTKIKVIASNENNSNDTEKPNENIGNSNNNECTLNISSGTKGLDDWYVSSVTLSLKMDGSDISGYGITTSKTPSYNSKKTLTINNEHNSKIYYGHVKYKDGSTSICSISLKIDKTKPTCSVSITSGSSKDTLNVTAKDSMSGVSDYSYNNSSYSNNNVYEINKGTKVTTSVKDKAGNIGTCVNYKEALILLGDSRTNGLRIDLKGESILTNYDNIYFIEKYDNEKKEVYAVTKTGAAISWLLGMTGTDSGAYQVQYLLSYLSRKPIYYDIKIASNLGVNDLNGVTSQVATKNYISAYDNLLKSSQNVTVDDKTKSCSWKKTGNIIKLNFYFISVNPIDEKQINECFENNKRTNAEINNFNTIMKNKYGSKYIDANSNFDNWFNEATKKGEFRYRSANCDGLHYSQYINKNYIYPFYKNKLLG